MMKSPYYIYVQPTWLTVADRYYEVELKDVYFEDRDDVYDLLFELMQLGIIERYPRKVYLPVAKRDEVHSIMISHHHYYVISNGISNCGGELIASPGGETNVKTSN